MSKFLFIVLYAFCCIGGITGFILLSYTLLEKGDYGRLAIALVLFPISLTTVLFLMQFFYKGAIEDE